MLRQQTSFHHLQVVVAGEVHHEVPGHGVFVAQVGVDDDALIAVQHIGHTPRGIAQVAAGCCAARAELAHHARQTLGPIAGAKRASFMGDTQNKNFFGGV